MTDPDCDRITIRIDTVTQDEPVHGLGSGDTKPDAIIKPDAFIKRHATEGRVLLV